MRDCQARASTRARTSWVGAAPRDEVEIPDDIVAALLGAIAGILTGLITRSRTLQSKWIERRIEELKLRVATYDTKLLEKRLDAYATLWALTEPTSRRYVAELPSKASELAKTLTEWYYQTGGMLMTARTREAFFAARSALEEVPNMGWSSTVVDRFSLLRTAICDDLTSRQGPSVKAREMA